MVDMDKDGDGPYFVPLGYHKNIFVGCRDNKGNQNSQNNPFHQSRVIFICTGLYNYDPSMPRVYHRNHKFRCIDGDCKTFVDNIRYMGDTWELCCAVTHQVDIIMVYLGFKYATIKRRNLTQAPG